MLVEIVLEYKNAALVQTSPVQTPVDIMHPQLKPKTPHPWIEKVLYNIVACETEKEGNPSPSRYSPGPTCDTKCLLACSLIIYT